MTPAPRVFTVTGPSTGGPEEAIAALGLRPRPGDYVCYLRRFGAAEVAYAICGFDAMGADDAAEFVDWRGQMMGVH
jgi:hypothetical protein